MQTNGTDIAVEPGLEDDTLRVQRLDPKPAGAIENAPVRRRLPDDPAGAVEASQNFALAPLVDKIAWGIARGLIVAVKELEDHIAGETRKVGDHVDRRMDTLQASLRELAEFVTEQRSVNTAVGEKCAELAVATASLQESGALQAAELEVLRTETSEFSATVSQRIEVATASLQEADARQAAELAALRTHTGELAASVSQRIDAATASLHEADTRQSAELSALRDETRAFSTSVSERIDSICKDLSLHQEDITALQSALSHFSARVDALAERLDRQAEAVRSMYSAYSQRETELEQLVEGLARLRANPTPLPKNGL
jgi:chromosome segregation ATPase